MAVLALAALALTSTSTTPTPPVTVTSSAGPATQALVLDLVAPVLDLESPVLDLTLTTASIDGSLTDAQGESERLLTLSADVLFAFNEATLAPKARTRLAQVATAIAAARAGSSPVAVRVDGYTDSRGAAAYNSRLSHQRAQAVADALRPLLVNVPVTTQVVGHGAADPVAPNTLGGEDNPPGRALNRRVTVSFATPNMR